MKCTKAIIAVAGYGTRRLPITKSLEKCMMPIGNHPITDYIVKDLVAAGITDIIFVVGEQAEQIRSFYGTNAKLEVYLDAVGKTAAIEEIRAVAKQANFHFVIQDNNQPYGTSTPLNLAKDYIEPGESFLFLYGDNVFYSPDGSSEAAHFLKVAEEVNAPAAMLGVEVPHELVGKYGIIATEKQGEAEYFQSIVEKPKPEEAPSNLNNGGCFLLEKGIFPFVQRSIDDSPQAECYLTDALNWYSQAGNKIAVVRNQGEYLDCGTVEGWLYANNRIVNNAS